MERLGVEEDADFAVSRKHFAEVELFRLCATASSFDQSVSSGAINLLTERERDGFGVNQTVCEFEVGTHAVGVHNQPRKERGEVVRCARSQADNFRYGFPFRLPGT